eukprot:7889521-Pyramimonas_sp.AAC.1
MRRDFGKLGFVCSFSGAKTVIATCSAETVLALFGLCAVTHSCALCTSTWERPLAPTVNRQPGRCREPRRVHRIDTE